MSDAPLVSISSIALFLIVPAARHPLKREHRGRPAARGNKDAGARPLAGDPATPRDCPRAAGPR